MARLLSCDDIWDMLSAYADDEVGPDEAAIVEKHVASCQACANDLNFMRQTARLLADTPEIAPPPGLREAIYAVTIHRPTRKSLWRLLMAPTPTRNFSLAGAAMATVALVAVFGLHGRPTTQPNMRGGSESQIARNDVRHGNSVTPSETAISDIPTAPNGRTMVASNSANLKPRTSVPGFGSGMLMTPTHHSAVGAHRADAAAHPDLTAAPTGSPETTEATKPVVTPIPVAPKAPETGPAKSPEAVAAAPTDTPRSIRIEATAQMDTRALSSLASIKEDFSSRRVNPSASMDDRRELKLDVVRASF